MSPLHKQARVLAEAGFKVFPCKENAKEPATPNGFKDATDDLMQIDAWWTENPKYNIAFEPETAGLAVLDLDPGGAEVWAQLIAEHGQHEPTYEVETPRGGRHLYFKGSLPSTAGRLGVHVDTRGIGGYVLVPPSVVGGKLYQVTHERDPAELPQWCATRIAARDHKTIVDPDKELDTPTAIDKARGVLFDYVKRGFVSRNDGKADTTAYIVAAKVRDCAVSRDVALRLMLEIWNPHCVDDQKGGIPYLWTPEELGVKVTNVYNHAQNTIGAHGVTMSAEERWANVPDIVEGLKGAPQRSRFHPMDEEEMEALPKPAWLIKDVFQTSGTAILYAGSGSYKSFVALDMAISIATGSEIFGDKPEPGLVFYGALEGLRNIAGQRRRAWKRFRKYADRLANFKLMPAPRLRSNGELQEFALQIEKKAAGQQVKLIVLDTVVKCMSGLDDGSSKDTGEFVAYCDALVEKFNCVVLAIHHKSNKSDENRGPKGSYNLIGGFDTILEIVKIKGAKMAIEVWVKKQKDAEERAFPWTFQGHVVQLSTDPDDKSLAFEPTTPEVHSATVNDADPFHRTKIATALVEKAAHSRDSGVATSTLAVALLGRAGVGDEKAIRTLEKLAAVNLRGYCEKVGKELIWFIPPKPEAPPMQEETKW